jgi:PKD repeat protein
MPDPAPVTAPAPAPAAPAKKHGFFKTVMIWMLGLGGGAFGTYSTAVFDKIIKPPLPVANFAVAADGLTITCLNHAAGNTGWWDYGDGTPLDPFSADQPSIAHTYAKPGSYAVKLTVRNLTSDENYRTVNVEVTAAGKDSPVPPKIASFSVQPASPSALAPAAFRVTAEVQNADYCVWDLGDGRTEVVEGGGKIDREFIFDQPGSFPLQLVAHNGKLASKQASTVKVDSPPSGTLTAVVTITDGGKRLERYSRFATLPIASIKGSTTFSKTLAAKPGHSFVEIAAAKAEVAGVKNLTFSIAADKKSATVTGEWINPGAAGTDALVSLKLTEERLRIRPEAVMHATGLLHMGPDNKASVRVPLPPLTANLQGFSRRIDVEVRQVGANGKVYVVAAGPVFGRGPVAIPAKNVYSPPTPAITTATYDIDSVTVQFEVRSIVQAGAVKP